MNLDTFLTIVCLVGVGISYIGFRLASENVRLTFKDQRVGGSR